MRSVTGVFAHAIPIAFVAATHLASPRARPMVLVAVNIMTQIAVKASSAALFSSLRRWFSREIMCTGYSNGRVLFTIHTIRINRIEI
ncbi:Vacuolar protein sorting/targeting protein VPS26 [Giardia duodenalis]|uniref:Vacuolar protein sorting/targeting protein VPS26 n=1 Tax=Giardia intestinalis TaxID=5741 RepID=V6TN32_GIAIN|nr:Vacuolar protein sorting/targeting protein VPS26 [Giardia intestinalis]